MSVGTSKKLNGVPVRSLNVRSQHWFCRVCDEVRNYFRPRQRIGETVSLGKRRELLIGRYLKLQDQFCVAV